MSEFLRSYGQWIFLGIMVLLMLRMHRSHGSGGSHGGMEHQDHHEAGVDEKDKKRGSGGGCH